jgi:hypothetical protein
VILLSKSFLRIQSPPIRHESTIDWLSLEPEVQEAGSVLVPIQEQAWQLHLQLGMAQLARRTGVP